MERTNDYRRRVRLAARLYTLAATVHTAERGAESELERAIALQAARSARRSLERLGFDAADILSIEDCAKAAGLADATNAKKD